jgi:hypothetical protein
MDEDTVRDLRVEARIAAAGAQLTDLSSSPTGLAPDPTPFPED